MDIAIMIEGQNGLNWPRWKRIVRAAEDLGYAGLYRSDHFTNANPPDLDSLELWVSLTWLASHTKRIEFGPLVTPFSFRHPAFTARMGAAVDDLSDGRLWLGVGAGWQHREHEHFGFDLLNIPGRMKRFEEGIRVVKQLLESDEPVNFTGTYYSLKEAILLPRPQRRGGPRLLVGGNGKSRTLPLAARYARAWNAVLIPPAEFKSLNNYLDELIHRNGRGPQEIARSMMTGIIYGENKQLYQQKLATRSGGKASEGQLRARGLICGTSTAVVDQLGELAEAGVERVMLQWLDLDDLDGLESLADRVLSQVS
jgi:F420-dependent oxidoreductase-like protein